MTNFLTTNIVSDIIPNNDKLINRHNKLVDKHNKIINKYINKDAKLINYIGEGYQGKIFNATLNNINVICKIINLVDNNNINNRRTNSKNNNNNNNIEKNNKKSKNILIELSILRMLKNITKINYIIPCLYFRLYDNQLYTFFPIFKGKNLYDMKKYLSKLDDNNYCHLIELIIRYLLRAITIIHSQNIAHQNLDDTNILVNFENAGLFKEDKFDLRLINFGLACGFYNVPPSIDNNLINIEQKYLINSNGNSNDNYNGNKSGKIYKNCLEIPQNFLTNKNMNKSIEMIDNMIKKITKNINNRELLYLAQKYDIWCCGIIIYDLIYCKWSNGYNQSIIDGYENHMSWLNTDKNNYKTNNIKLPNKLNNYINIIKNNILITNNKRWDAKHILDHLNANY